MAKGRQTIVITKEQIEDLPRLARAGLNLDQMAAYFGCCPATFDEIIKRQPEVKQAIERGRADAIIKVGSTAFQQAVSGKVPAMTMFYLKCRAGWREQDVQKDDDKPETPKTLAYNLEQKPDAND